jgi:hypothetical protein
MGLSPISHRIYHKPYPSIFDSVAYPAGWRVPDFSKFDGEGSRTTWEHVSQYLAQLGEAGSVEALHVRLFSVINRNCFCLVFFTPCTLYLWMGIA